MKVLSLLAVLACCSAFCAAQGTSLEPQEESKESEAPSRREEERGGGVGGGGVARSPTFIPRRRFLSFVRKQSKAPAENVVGKSPCPRGLRGTSCREDLIDAARTCSSGTCMRCRRECSAISPTMWPTCCREHFLCCRQLIYACQRCSFPELFPFCTTAFKKCF